ncbi:hypothetical protein FQZ97_906380 [compost metagenome]
MVQAVDVGTEVGAQGGDGVQGGVHHGDVGVGATGDFHACGARRGVGVRRVAQGGGQGGELGGDVHGQGFSGGGTDLEVHRGGQLAVGAGDHGTVTEQLGAGIAGVLDDIGQFLAQLVVLALQGGQVGGGVGAVGALGGEVLHALEDVGHLAEGALGGLQHGDGVAGVAHGHVHATGLGVEAGGDLQAGGVVGGGVDAQAGAQALLVGAQLAIGLVQVGLGDQGGVVGVNRQSHWVIPRTMLD